jgi:hypothetical protein
MKPILAMHLAAKLVCLLATSAAFEAVGAQVSTKHTAGAPLSTKRIHPEEPQSTRFVTVLGVATLPPDQRAVVYARPHSFPALLVVMRAKDGTAEDLAAGYEAALRMIGPNGPKHGKPVDPQAQMRTVIGPSAVRPLEDARRDAFARYVAHLARSNDVTVDGIGTGPLLRIAKRM